MAAPIKVGIIIDIADAPPSPSDIESWLARVAEDYRTSGRLDRPVEFVSAFGLGLPGGTAAAVDQCFAALDRQDVLMIVGPMIGDNALLGTPIAERLRIPTINWAGAERARGDYMFHLQVGSHEDESLVIARHLAAAGARRVGVVHDRSPIGRRHMEFLQSEAEVIGLDIVAVASISPLAEEAGPQVARLRDARADAVAYLGLGLAAPAVARAMAEDGWTPPRIMNTAGLRGYDPAFAKVIDGWHYVDMFSDGNRTLADYVARNAIPSHRRLAAAKGYDLGRLVAEGLARAPELTREGIKAGLEQVKWLPAAEGHDGTLLGFGTWDRGALHGRYLVVRQWVDGETVEVG